MELFPPIHCSGLRTGKIERQPTFPYRIVRLARYPGTITTSGTSSRVSRLTIKVDVCASFIGESRRVARSDLFPVKPDSVGPSIRNLLTVLAGGALAVKRSTTASGFRSS